MSQTYTVGKGQKYKISGTGRNPALNQSDISRVLPRQLSTGSTRGTQTVGYGDTKIDGTNNRITIGSDSSGTIGMGTIPGFPNEIGFFIQDSNNKLVAKWVNGTIYYYDVVTGLNTMQEGILPSGTTGIAVAKEGYNVADGYV